MNESGCGGGRWSLLHDEHGYASNLGWPRRVLMRMMLYACYYYVACGRRHGRCAVLERGVGLGRDVVWASVLAAFAGGGVRGVPVGRERGVAPAGLLQVNLKISKFTQ